MRDVVVYPHMVVGQEKSIRCLEAAMDHDKKSCWLRRKASTDEPGVSGAALEPWRLFLRMLKLPDGTVKVLVEGLQRAHILRCLIMASISRQRGIDSPAIVEREQEVLVRTAISWLKAISS
ncbi:hypothetical protein MJ579_06760 [Klebsiella pneumoniae]|nr:hypothetical protein MJ579_06760 [Klebsiella pneumoniae]